MYSGRGLIPVPPFPGMYLVVSDTTVQLYLCFKTFSSIFFLGFHLSKLCKNFPSRVSRWYSLFFVLYVLLGVYFVTNLILAVVYDSFKSQVWNTFIYGKHRYFCCIYADLIFLLPRDVTLSDISYQPRGFFIYLFGGGGDEGCYYWLGCGSIKSLANLLSAYYIILSAPAICQWLFSQDKICQFGYHVLTSFWYS